MLKMGGQVLFTRTVCLLFVYEYEAVLSLAVLKVTWACSSIQKWEQVVHAGPRKVSADPQVAVKFSLSLSLRLSLSHRKKQSETDRVCV